MNTIVYTIEEQFRAVMELPLAAENEARLRAALQELMYNLLADPQRKHDFKLQSMLLACKMRMRALQNLIACGKSETTFWRCDIRSMAEDICSAADLLLSPLDRAVHFEAPEEYIEAACSPRDFSWLVLELICNAARHTHGEDITVRMQPKRPLKHRKPNACVLTAESAGSIDLGQLHASCSREGSGVSAMLRTAQLHNSTLLWLGRDGQSVAAWRFPLQKPSGLLEWEAPDLVELLSDQCSQVYVALAQVCG